MHEGLGRGHLGAAYRCLRIFFSANVGTIGCRSWYDNLPVIYGVPPFLAYSDRAAVQRSSALFSPMMAQQF